MSTRRIVTPLILAAAGLLLWQGLIVATGLPP